MFRACVIASSRLGTDGYGECTSTVTVREGTMRQAPGGLPVSAPFHFSLGCACAPFLPCLGGSAPFLVSRPGRAPFLRRTGNCRAAAYRATRAAEMIFLIPARWPYSSTPAL